MTKNILFSAIFFGLAFVACSDDDDEAVVATIDNIAGEYVGSATGTMILINASGEELPYDIVSDGDEVATVRLNSDGTITVVEPTFYSASPVTYDSKEKYAYPGAIISKISPVQDAEGVSFEVKEYSSMNGAYTVAGDIAGQFEGKSLTLDYTFLHAGGMIGTVHFEGVRK